MSEVRRRLMMAQALTWLYPATQAVIMDVFGNDGEVVIKATNDYLSNIARTDPAKAQALARFINEDPMMVCSLGLEVEGVTMPIRWLVSDKNCKINADLSMDMQETDYKIELSSAVASAKEWGAVFANNWHSNNYTIWRICTVGSKLVYSAGTSAGTTSVTGIGYDGVVRKYTMTYHKLVVDSSKFTSSGNTSNYVYDKMIVMSGVAGKIDQLLVSKNGTDLLHLIPCHDKTQGNGMLDLVNVVFYPNAGTGQFTIPDISYPPAHRNPLNQK